MEAFLAAIQVWFERSKLPTAVVASTIIFSPFGTSVARLNKKAGEVFSLPALSCERRHGDPGKKTSQRLSENRVRESRVERCLIFAILRI